MDKEWTIERVSQEPAREWNNPKGGIVYYKKVKLVGYDKPVSVGKKDPSVLQPGGKLSGHIEVNVSDAEDKFKPAPMGFAGGNQSSFGGGSKPAYKDNSDGQRQGMCFNNAANYLNAITEPGKEKPLSAEQWAAWVHSYANALYKLGDLGEANADTLKAQTSPTTSNPAKAHSGRDPLWPSDHAKEPAPEPPDDLIDNIELVGEMPEDWLT